MRNSLAIILIFYLVQTAHVYAWFDQYKVVLYNSMSNGNLEHHCQSKDTDFGWKILRPREAFSWTFKENIFRSTLYFCRFRACGGEKALDVFNKRIADVRCPKTRVCLYSISGRSILKCRRGP